MSPASQPLYCPQCGYDVRAATRSECPECGQAINLDELRQSQIPWSHRAAIGRLRAYWRTVWRVTFHTHDFCAEAVRPVSYRDARRFQLVTVVIAYLSIVGFFAALWMLEVVDEDTWAPLVYNVGEPLTIVLAVAAAASLALYLLAATGVHTYWFHPRSLDVTRQNRALAMSYYACAPLALMPIVFVGWGLTAALSNRSITGREVYELRLLIGLMTFAFTLLLLAAWWLTCIRMLAIGARRSAAAVAVFAVALPLLWALLAVFILAGIPIAIAYAAAMIVVILV